MAQAMEAAETPDTKGVDIGDAIDSLVACAILHKCIELDRAENAPRDAAASGRGRACDDVSNRSAHWTQLEVIVERLTRARMALRVCGREGFEARHVDSKLCCGANDGRGRAVDPASGLERPGVELD